MARSGVSEVQIRQIIKQMEGKGVQPTVTLIRQQLGKGSYSTISGVLNSWKEERQRGVRRAVPEVPADVSALFQQLWNEAFAHLTPWPRRSAKNMGRRRRRSTRMSAR